MGSTWGKKKKGAEKRRGGWEERSSNIGQPMWWLFEAFFYVFPEVGYASLCLQTYVKLICSVFYIRHHSSEKKKMYLLQNAQRRKWAGHLIKKTKNTMKYLAENFAVEDDDKEQSKHFRCSLCSVLKCRGCSGPQSGNIIHGTAQSLHIATQWYYFSCL